MGHRVRCKCERISLNAEGRLSSLWTDANGVLAAWQRRRDFCPPRRVSMKTGLSLGWEENTGNMLITFADDRNQGMKLP